MTLEFDRGDPQSPVGHALMYFRDGEEILATYVSVPPIPFDISSYMPPFLQTAMQGMQIEEGASMATPIPPIPEPVESYDYLIALAERRHEDLISLGSGSRSDPMRLAAEIAEAAREYGGLYQSSIAEEPVAANASSSVSSSRFEGLTEEERLNELTHLTGRLLDSLSAGSPDQSVLAEMEELSSLLPPKYRVRDLIQAAQQPGERGRKLADLYLRRSYKLYHEEYLDLEELDREIAATQA